MKTSVIILNYNGQHFLQEYLPSVLQSIEDVDDTEIVVADNASNDESLELLHRKFPQVKTIAFDQNYGYAKGYNKAISRIESEYVVLLNSDVEVDWLWLKPLQDFMDDNPDVVACQPKILSKKHEDHFEYAGAAGGFIDYLGYPFCRGRIFNAVEPDFGQYDNAIDVFWASGACLMIRRDDFLKAGGFDEDFFAHMEEIDLCWRLRNRGARIVCIPSSVIYHVGGGTLPMNHPHKIYLNFRNNLLTLYKNLPDNKLRTTIWKRKVMDGLSAIMFLFSGKWNNFKSVLKAHHDFEAMKDSFKIKRQHNLSLTTVNGIDEIYTKSIVWSHYVARIKKFSKLKWKTSKHL